MQLRYHKMSGKYPICTLHLFCGRYYANTISSFLIPVPTETTYLCAEMISFRSEALRPPSGESARLTEGRRSLPRRTLRFFRYKADRAILELTNNLLILCFTYEKVVSFSGSPVIFPICCITSPSLMYKSMVSMTHDVILQGWINIRCHSSHKSLDV